MKKELVILRFIQLGLMLLVSSILFYGCKFGQTGKSAQTPVEGFHDPLMWADVSAPDYRTFYSIIQ